MILRGQTEFVEVQYFFKLTLEPGRPSAFAMVSVYSRPDADLLQQSSNALWSCKYRGKEELVVIDVKSIMSVVAMVPHPPMRDEALKRRLAGRVFVVEKLGLDALASAGMVHDDELQHDT